MITIQLLHLNLLLSKFLKMNSGFLMRWHTFEDESAFRLALADLTLLVSPLPSLSEDQTSWMHSHSFYTKEVFSYNHQLFHLVSGGRTTCHYHFKTSGILCMSIYCFNLPSVHFTDDGTYYTHPDIENFVQTGRQDYTLPLSLTLNLMGLLKQPTNKFWMSCRNESGNPRGTRQTIYSICYGHTRQLLKP